MRIIRHSLQSTKIAEVVSDDLVINNQEVGLQILMDLYYQDFDRIIIYEKNITSEFFNLKNGMAGEILQKVSNYRLRLTIVGDFSMYESKSLEDFIRERNKGKQVNFLNSLDKALERLSE